MTSKLYFTYQDIAGLLGLSVSRVRHLVAEGKLDTTLKGACRYIVKAVLDELQKTNNELYNARIDHETLKLWGVEVKSESLNDKDWETD